MTKMATLAEASKDAVVAFGFEFNGAQWFVVIRRTALIGVHARVDMFEDGEAVGVGYLLPEDGPMFDASEHTPLGGKSIYTEEGEEIPMDGGNASDRFGEILHYHYTLVASRFKASTVYAKKR